MSNIENVAKRLKGLREALDLTAEQIAESTGVSLSVYENYENGMVDIPVSFLHNISNKYGVALSALLFGDEPKMKSYFVTRKGCGEKVERTKSYSYQSLAAGFSGKALHPFLVTVEPYDGERHTNTHTGQEWNYLLEGKMEITIDNNVLVLNPGDAIMFDASQPHKMRALDGTKVVFIAIIA